jgi:hypothetical protein
VEARRAKAQRGELLVAAAVGYRQTDAPHVEKDPDRRVLARLPEQPADPRTTVAAFERFGLPERLG